MVVFLYAIILVVFLWICYWYYKVIYLNNKLKTIKGPFLVPLIGNALIFKNATEVLDTFMQLIQKYDGCVRTVIGFDVTITFTNYSLIEKLHTSTSLIKKSKFYHYLEPWLGTGLLTSKNPKWKIHRKLITPAFHFKILEQFVDVFQSNATIFNKEIATYATNGISFDIYNYILKLSLDIICESAMGTSVNAQQQIKSEYVDCVKDMSRIMQARIFSPIQQFDSLFQLTSNGRKQKYNLKVLHDFTNAVIKKRRCYLEDLEHSADQVRPGQMKLAFLDLLLMSNVNGTGLTDEEIREEVDTFMFEGHDTVASAIGFSLYLLAENPDVQEKVYAELRSLLYKSSSMDINTLNSMKYMALVIKETLRLYPSVPFYARCLTEDLEFEGNLIKRGTTLNVFAYGLHRDPKIYIDPEKYNPDRFANYDKNKGDVSAFSFLPFSAGPRNCIGQKFAILEIKTVLANFLMKYEALPAVPPFKLILTADAVLKPQNGIFVRIRKRLQAM